jgi:L-ribulose-5-phosphate 3-epimerase
MPITIGICTWSLDHHGQLPTAYVLQLLHQLNLTHIHLNLNPILDAAPSDRPRLIDEWRTAAKDGIHFAAAMVSFPGENYHSHATIQRTGGYVPDDQFDARLTRTTTAAQICRELNINLLTTHAGFLPDATPPNSIPAPPPTPHSSAEPFHPSSFSLQPSPRPLLPSPQFGKMLTRLRTIADLCASHHLTLALETGQETAATLLNFLTALDRPTVGINFDPANMLLYDKGDPLAAADLLFDHILHIHAKDTKLRPPTDTGWAGDEVPLGHGDARLPDLLTLLHHRGYTGTISIEREFGASRLQDAHAGITFLRQHLLV